MAFVKEAVGLIEGAFDATPIGDDDGKLVVMFVMSDDGLTEATPTGLSDGLSVERISVGLSDTTPEGLSETIFAVRGADGLSVGVGIAEGLLEGPVVGFSVELVVGSIEGKSVDDTVGTSVGETGAIVGT